MAGDEEWGRVGKEGMKRASLPDYKSPLLPSLFLPPSLSHSVPFGVVVRIWMRGSFSDWALTRSPFSLPPPPPPLQRPDLIAWLISIRFLIKTEEKKENEFSWWQRRLTAPSLPFAGTLIFAVSFSFMWFARFSPSLYAFCTHGFRLVQDESGRQK